MRLFSAKCLGPFVALLLVGTVTGCDLVKKLKGEAGESTGDTPSANAKENGGKPSAGCDLPAEITANVTVKKGCSLTLKNDVTVRAAATLRIEAGVKIAVEQGHYIWIEDGKLVAKGTEKEPIVLTSANKTQAPGDWVGIGLEEKTQSGTEIDFVHIEYAGSTTSGGHGSIDIQSQHSAGRISITNTQITSSDQAAVKNDSAKGGFARFEKNTFKKNKISLDVEAQVLGSVGGGNVFSDPIHVRGPIAENATWPAVDAPIVVEQSVEVAGERTAANLTIQPKTVVKFSAGQYLAVGERNGGGLVANGVTFTSANGTPHPGDWIGIFLYDRATNVSLDGAIIEYAGHEGSGGRAAITFYDVDAKKLRGVKIANTTFRHNANAAMASPDHDCGPFVAGNKSDVAICRPE